MADRPSISAGGLQRVLEFAGSVEADTFDDLGKMLDRFFFTRNGVGADKGLYIGGYALLFFPMECGFLEMTTDTDSNLRSCTTATLDMEPLVHGLDAAMFAHRLGTFDCVSSTPNHNLPMTIHSGPLGFVLHKQKRALEVVGSAFAVIDRPQRVVRLMPNVRGHSEGEAVADQLLANAHCREYVSQDEVDGVQRALHVTSLVRLLDLCNGKVDTAMRLVGKAIRRTEHGRQYAEVVDSVIQWPSGLQFEETLAFVEKDLLEEQAAANDDSPNDVDPQLSKGNHSVRSATVFDKRLIFQAV